MTAAPKTSISVEAIQKKKGDIGEAIRFPGFRVRKKWCGAGPL
jgi:hypothetical protein